MGSFLTIALIGILATAAMTAFLWLLGASRLADVDMVRALGSFFTRSLDGALTVGLLVHFSVGSALAFLYVYLLEIPEVKTMAGYTALGSFLGAMHGLVVSIAMIVLVAEHHPLPRFQKAGVKVALYHMIAHVVYGGVVGALAEAWLAQPGLA